MYGRLYVYKNKNSKFMYKISIKLLKLGKTCIHK